MERTEDRLRTAVLMLPPPRDSTLQAEEFGCLDAGGASEECGGEAGGLGGRASGGLHCGAAYECGRATGGLDGGAADKGGELDGGDAGKGGALDGGGADKGGATTAATEGGLAGAEPDDHATADGTQSTGSK